MLSKSSIPRQRERRRLMPRFSIVPGIKARRRVLPYVLLAPALLGIIILQVYPFALGLWYTFNNVQLAKLTEYTFVGLENLRMALASRAPLFWGQVVANSLIFTFGSIAGQIGIGLGLAVLLQQKWVKGRDFFRAIYLIPWVIAGVIVGYTWRFMYDPRVGLLNTVLWMLGGLPVSWLGSPASAMGSLIIANIWRGTGFSLVMQSAGLQSIPDELYDASLVDGASSWGILAYIMLPLLRPFILIDLIITTLKTINVFDLLYVMTNGGPLFRTETLSLFMYHQAFDMGYVGRGAAVASIILLICVILTVIYFRLLPGEEQAA